MLLEKLRVGDTVKIKGPEGLIRYTGAGVFSVMGHFFHANRVNFVVGGTGITPALAVIRALLEVPQGPEVSDAQVRLVCSNKTPEDVLCDKELRVLQEEYPERIQVWHVITRVTGHVDEVILREHFFPPAPETVCFVCGPPAFVAKAVMPALESIGFDDDHVFEF